MVKHNNRWGTVCDDNLESPESEQSLRAAQSACYTLGLSGGSIQKKYSYSGSETSYLMDGVVCPSNTTNFLECKHNNWGSHDCGDNYPEHVLLTCT